MPLDTINKKIGITRKRKSNLLKYLKIVLYRRLKDLNRYINKQNKINAKEFQISSFDSPSQSDSHKKTDLQLIKEIYKPQLIQNGNQSELTPKIKKKLQLLLTKKQKQIFQLHYVENYSVSEIAKQLKTSRPNISQIIKRIQPSLTKIKAELSTSKSCDAPVW